MLPGDCAAVWDRLVLKQYKCAAAVRAQHDFCEVTHLARGQRVRPRYRLPWPPFHRSRITLEELTGRRSPGSPGRCSAPSPTRSRTSDQGLQLRFSASASLRGRGWDSGSGRRAGVRWVDDRTGHLKAVAVICNVATGRLSGGPRTDDTLRQQIAGAAGLRVPKGRHHGPDHAEYEVFRHFWTTLPYRRPGVNPALTPAPPGTSWPP